PPPTAHRRPHPFPPRRSSDLRHKAVLDRARQDPGVEVVAGGTYDDSVGWFVRPTIAVVEDPAHEMVTTEYFGPILTVHVYPDRSDRKSTRLNSSHVKISYAVF